MQNKFPASMLLASDRVEGSPLMSAPRKAGSRSHRCETSQTLLAFFAHILTPRHNPRLTCLYQCAFDMSDKFDQLLNLSTQSPTSRSSLSRAGRLKNSSTYLT